MVEIVNVLAIFGKELLHIADGNSNSTLGQKIEPIIYSEKHLNHWFIEEFMALRLKAVAHFLCDENLKSFCQLHSHVIPSNSTIGVISEEKIPLQEFSILLGVLLSGNTILYKTNDKSDRLLQLLFSEMGERVLKFNDRIRFTDGLIKNIDSYIIHSSANSTKSYSEYFKKKKLFFEEHIQSVAILKGNETQEELSLLGNDIFNYFGLGAGNVKKIFVPYDYNFNQLFESIEPWNKVMKTNAWVNNYQYHQTVFLMNKIQHLDNGFLLLHQTHENKAPTGVLYYAYYTNFNDSIKTLTSSDEIYRLYMASPLQKSTYAFGSSVNQLLHPSEKLIRFWL